jgi:hypothetical protein
VLSQPTTTSTSPQCIEEDDRCTFGDDKCCQGLECDKKKSKCKLTKAGKEKIRRRH